MARGAETDKPVNSPMTGVALANSVLTPNFTLRAMISDFLDQNQ